MSFPEPIYIIRTASFNKSLGKNVDIQFHANIEENLKKLETPNSNNCDIEHVRSAKLSEKTYRYKFGNWRIFFLISEDSKQFTLLNIERRQSKSY